MKISSFLKSKGFSGTVIKQLRSGNYVSLNGKFRPVTFSVCTGDTLSVTVIETEPSEFIIPDGTPLNTVYEDEDILVADKPSGMAVHPSQGNHCGTLASAFASHCPGSVFRCINRLDKNTSGLVLIAKNRLSAAILTDSLSHREIHREYFAVCEGLLPERGTIDVPIGREDGSTLARRADPCGAAAVTHYERLSYANGYSSARIWLDTGRTHQIRVHFRHIGHPLPGDFIYNPNYSDIDRTALHSRKLSFSHPITGESMSFTADLPEDLSHIASIAGYNE